MKRTLVFELGSIDMKVYDLKEKKLYKEKNFLAYKLEFDYSNIQLISRSLEAFGNEAYDYFERNPQDIEVIQCIEDGKIMDLENQELLVKNVTKKHNLFKGISEPNVFCVMSKTVTPFEKNCYLSSINFKNCNELYIEDIISTDKQISTSKGRLVVILGYDYSYIMVVSKSTILFVKKVTFNSEKLDEDVSTFVRYNYFVKISRRSAQKAREELGVVNITGDNISVPAMHIKSGLPINFTLNDGVIKTIYESSIRQLIYEIEDIIKRLPHEVLDNVLNEPICFAGGLSKDVSLMDIVSKRFKMEYYTLDIEELILSASKEDIIKWSN